MICPEYNARLDKMNKVLNTIPILESDYIYQPYMCPIKEKNGIPFISYSDITEFAETHAISDLGYALHIICEANNIDDHKIGCIFYEEDIIDQPKLQILVEELKNKSVPVLLDNYLESKIFGNTALDMLVEEYLIEAYGGLAHIELHGSGADQAQSAKEIEDLMMKSVNMAVDDLQSGNKDTFDATKAGLSNMFKMGAKRNVFYRQQVFGNNNGEKYDLDAPAAFGDRALGNVHMQRTFVDNFKNIKTSEDFRKKLPTDVFGLDAKSDANTIKKFDSLSMEMNMRLLKKIVMGQKDRLENDANNLRNLAQHIEKQQIPQNIISRMIGKLRNLYQKVMIKLQTGLSQNRDLSKFQLYIEKQQEELGDKNPGKWQTFKNLLKYLWLEIKTKLKNLAGKILFCIDKLLQKVQNASNKYLWKDQLLAPSNNNDKKE